MEGGDILQLALLWAEPRAERHGEGLRSRSNLLMGGIPCVMSFRTSMSGSERGLRVSKPKVNDAVFDVGEPKRNGGDFLTSIAGSMGGASWNGFSTTSIDVLVEGSAVGTSNVRVFSRCRFEIEEGDVDRKGVIVGFSVAILSKTNFH